MTGLNMKKRMAVALMIIALLFSFHGVLAEGSPPSTGETESVSYKMDFGLADIGSAVHLFQFIEV